MTLAMRPYQDEGDSWRIRDFLRQVFLLNGRRETSWHVARWDYWRWHGVENIEHCRLEDVVFLWEAADGQLAAVLNCEGRGEAHLQVHPSLRRAGLEEEMLRVAEARLSEPGADGRPKLRVWATAHNATLEEPLVRRGYALVDGPEHQRCREVTSPIPDVPIAAGYTVRALGDVEELPARTWASWRAFHPDEPDEGYGGWEWYLNIQRGPLYRRDLDLVAITPDGECAAFCTIWYDDVTRSAYFEPVGTAPEHQRRGLGRALLYAGLRRLARLGATLAFVGGYSVPANGLYAAAGFAEYALLRPWAKEV
jgi:mycothiol synthase